MSALQRSVRASVLKLLVCAVFAAALSGWRSARAELVDILPRIKPSIVAVGTYLPTRNPSFRFLGTGFAVGGALVATNAHVVPNALQAEQMEVMAIAVPAGGQTAVRRAARVASDSGSDLALLRIEGPPLSSLQLASSSLLQEGRSVAFTGFPIGSALGLTPVTHRGIIAAVTPIVIPQANAQQLSPAVVRRITDGGFRVYQLDATAYPGNSGSPLFDVDTGEVVGVVNMVFVKGTKETVLSDPSGITYAIPVSYLRNLMNQVQ